MTRRTFAVMASAASLASAQAIPDTSIEYIESPDKASFRLHIKSVIKCDVIRVLVKYKKNGVIETAEGIAPWIAPDVVTQVNPGFLFPSSYVVSVELTFLNQRTLRIFRH